MFTDFKKACDELGLHNIMKIDDEKDGSFHLIYIHYALLKE